MKKIIAAVFLAGLTVQVSAQSGTNSPYSQYGLGALASQATGFNRGMNGLAYGFHEHNQVNYMNPASYASVDSLSFIFDAGVSLQLTNFDENGNKVNAHNADIEYVAASFRVFKHVGVSFGILPYSNVGYNFSNTQNVNAFPSTSSPNATYSNIYSGNGGLHMVYLGAGWEPFKGIAFGANISYLWGTLNRSSTNTYSDSYVNTLSKNYTAQVKSYKVDLGAQFTCPINKKNELTLGLAYSLGHNLGAEPECSIISTNSQTSVSDTTRYVVSKAFEIPQTFGVGLMWNHNNRLKFGVDYQMQKWVKIQYPQLITINGKTSYSLVDGQFTDRHKLTVGGDYCKGERYRGFFSRMHYRGGVSYATPYLRINGQEGPRELSASFGVGIPIINGYNNRSMLNISAEWVNQKAVGLIKENTFRINVGLTFNERWFAKFKVE
ncbi:hypothetical protein [Prevotella fusca]|uniref:Outer membrane protein n=1 Tax=Prevotella fusca JCM 17724 TaxID=1236517 RepID=A0A0K1NLI9_9BACT|nr:hypothetical protein [Prevotella fusca]AKU69748.1 hypothetical protein ADJ77_07655 [Prevotella fusca JCM 17724]QUB85356.1 hypothetical protein J5A51_03515 [Prevotella fusca JCM 17724]